jgi:hypothetical protein
MDFTDNYQVHVDTTQQKLIDLRESIRQRLLLNTLFKDSPVNVTANYWGENKNTSFEECSIPDEELEEFFNDFVDQQHPRWYRDEGGFGTITWNLVEDEIVLEHSERVMSTIDHRHVFPKASLTPRPDESEAAA